MEDQIKTLISLQLMNAEHEAVLVLIVDLSALYAGLAEKPGIVSNDIALRVSVKSL
jgi:hypothetical protein